MKKRKGDDHLLKHKCSKCAKSFKYVSDRIRHENSHSVLYKCEICGKSFNYISALRRHEKQHNRTGSVFCKNCGKQFRDEILLKRHVNYAHKGTFECLICESVFSSEKALHTHMLTHNPANKRRYKCNFKGCQKTFNFSHHLKNHEFTHGNEKRYVCPSCGKGFIQVHHLVSHQKIHSPESWLSCTVQGCQKTFPTEYSRKKHLTKHEEGLCASCGGLYTKKHLETHVFKCKSSQDIVLNLNNNATVEDNIVPYKSKLKETKLDTKHNINVIAVKPNDEKSNSYNVKDDQDRENYDMTSDCKSILGGCIANIGDKEDNNCFCDEISRKSKSIAITLNNETNSSDKTKKVYETNINNLDSNLNTNVIETVAFNPVTINTEEPDIEFDVEKIKPCLYSKPKLECKDGAIKLTDICDDNILELFYDSSNNKSDNDVPFNSCKSVLGNCIVSGNDTIGEGCLCARMTQESPQMAQQEMENITIADFNA